MQIDSTSGPSPTTRRRPRLACRTRSMPSRNGWPGATRARASAMAELGRTTTSAWYPALFGAIRPPQGVDAAPVANPDRLGQGPHVHDLHPRRTVRDTTRARGRGGTRRAPPRPAGAGRGAPAGSRPPDPPRRTRPGRGAGDGRRTRRPGPGQRQIGGGLEHADAAHGRGEHVGAHHGHPGPLFEHGQQQRQPTAVHPLGRAPTGGLRRGLRRQRLHLDQQGPLALHGGEHRAPRRPRAPVAEEELIGVGHRSQAGVAHLEEPELPGRPEPVLGGPHHAQRVVAVSLDGEDRVHQVLEGAGAGQGPLLGHVAHQHERHVVELGQVHHDVGARPHLGEAPGGARCARVGHGLDRVDDHEGRRRVAQGGGQDRQIRAVEDHEPGGKRPQALGPAPHLLGRLLGRHEQHGPTGTGHGRQDLEQQGRLPHPGLPAEQGHRPGDEPPAEHPVELGQPGGDGARTGRVDLVETQGPPGALGLEEAQEVAGIQVGRIEVGRSDGPARRGGLGHGLLDQAVPLPASRAATSPARGSGSTRRTPVHRPRPSHTGRLGTGCDGQALLRSRRPLRPARPAAARALRRCGRRSRRPPRRR